MINLEIEQDEFMNFFIKSINKFTSNEGKPIGIGVSLNEASKEISIHYNIKYEIMKKENSIDQFEFQRYEITKYKKRGKVNLWKSIRMVSKEIELPTVLYHVEDTNLFDLPIETETEVFGRAVIKYFRDDTMNYHSSYSDRFANKNLDEIKSEFRENWSEESKKEQLENALFFTSLNRKQIDFLNDYILRILDNAAFNVMRALDEKTGYEGSQINLDINGIKVTELNLIGNGNLSGEYLDWIDRFSKYKEFQT